MRVLCAELSSLRVIKKAYLSYKINMIQKGENARKCLGFCSHLST